MRERKKGAIMLLWLACFLAAPAMAQTPGNVGEAVIDPMLILKRMSDFVAAAPALSVTVRAGYDVVQDSGEKLEFGEVVRYSVKRPDRFRVEGEQSSGQKGFILFDGKEIVAMGAGQNAYAAASKPGTLDDAIPYMVGALELRIPLARLFVHRVTADIADSVKSARYVGTDFLMGLPCDHVAARTETVDFQVWVAQGDRPLPHRIVLTYKKEAGQPKFWGQFTDWNLNPDLPDSLFTFTPPSGAERVRFLAEVEEQLLERAASRSSRGKGGRR